MMGLEMKLMTANSFLYKSNHRLIYMLYNIEYTVFEFEKASYLYFIVHILAMRNVFMCNRSNRSRTNKRATRSADS